MANKKKTEPAQKKAEVKKTHQKKSIPKKAAPKKAAPKKGNSNNADKVAKTRKILTTASDDFGANLQLFEIHKIFGVEYAKASNQLTDSFRAWCYRENRWLQDEWTDERTAIAAAERHSNTVRHPSTVMIKRRN